MAATGSSSREQSLPSGRASALHVEEPRFSLQVRLRMSSLSNSGERLPIIVNNAELDGQMV